MSTAKKTLYAAIGAGGVALEAARTLPQRVQTLPSTLASRVSELKNADITIAPIKLPKSLDLRDLPKTVQSIGMTVPERATKLVGEAKGLSEKATKHVTGVYVDLTKRGEKAVKRVQKSAPTKKAKAQSKTAKSKAKAATTSAKKAVGATVEAAGAAVTTATEAV